MLRAMNLVVAHIEHLHRRIATLAAREGDHIRIGIALRDDLLALEDVFEGADILLVALRALELQLLARLVALGDQVRLDRLVFPLQEQAGAPEFRLVIFRASSCWRRGRGSDGDGSRGRGADRP